MTETRTASRQITDEVTSWPGVEAGPGRRGEFALKVAGREFGHAVFPGKAGPAARRIHTHADVEDVIELLRLNYDRIVQAHPR